MLPAPVAPFSYDKVSAETAIVLRQHAAQIRSRVKEATSAIIDIGQDLIAVKQKLEHGQFSEWVLAECAFSLRSAENYIRAAKFAEGKNATVALLPPATFYKLAAKSTPPKVVHAVIERLQSGARVTSDHVAAALSHAQQERRLLARKQRISKTRSESQRGRKRREAKRAEYQEDERIADEKALAVAQEIANKLGPVFLRALKPIFYGGESYRVEKYFRMWFSDSPAEHMPIKLKAV